MPPPNDNWQNAIAISGASGNIAGTNVGATIQAGEFGYWSNELAKVSVQGQTPVQGTPTCCPIPPLKTVWYSWAGSGSLVIEFKCTSVFPSVVQVYISGSDGSPSREVAYIYNQSLGVGGGASYNSAVSFDQSANAAANGYLIRVGGRNWVTIGTQTSPIYPFGVQAAPSEGTFTLSWQEWARPSLGPCNACFDTQSENCSTKQFIVNGNETWQDTDYYQLWETQTVAGYYKLIYCGGGLRHSFGDIINPIPDNLTVELFSHWVPGIGRLYHYVPGIGPGAQLENGFWNDWSTLYPNLTTMLTALQCVESNWFCSTSDWGFFFAHATRAEWPDPDWTGGEWTTLNTISLDCNSTCTDVTCGPSEPGFDSPVLDQDGNVFASFFGSVSGSTDNPPGCTWNISTHDCAPVSSGSVPPAYRIVFNPLIAGAFSPSGAGFSTACGISGENTDGTHWCYNFTVTSLQNMTWPSVTFNLLSTGGITPLTGAAVTKTNISQNQIVGSIGSFGFSADIYHQFCTASLSVADSCQFTGSGTIDFPLYPTVAIQLTGQNLGEVTFGGQKYQKFQVQVTESENFTPPGWNQSIRQILISVDAAITYILDSTMTAQSYVLAQPYNGPGVNLITFYIEAAAVPVNCNLRIVPQLGVWPYYPIFSVPITINAA